VRDVHTKQPALSRYVLLISLVIGLTLTCAITTANAGSHSADDTFGEAVQAVKDRDYGRALKLFEQQANDAKHDAQYNMAILLQAGKGQPRNYVDALYWGWLAQLGGIEEAENLVGDILDALTENDAEAVRGRVNEALQARLDNGDINAIAQFADYHLSIMVEPDYGTAYIWYSIAAALNIPEMADRRDDAENEIESEELARLQTEAKELFYRYNFAPFKPNEIGGADGN
jgi:hypothetical protein